MAEVSIQILNKHYNIACDEGQEQRIVDLANFLDGRLKELSSMGAGTNEAHLFVLNSIMMADELFDARDNSANTNQVNAQNLQITQEDEEAITDAIDQMAKRIKSIEGNLAAL
ncbi:MAG: cell division protein ZapA [Pseudomonadota bacterium]